MYILYLPSDFRVAYTAVSRKVVQLKSMKAHATILKGMMVVVVHCCIFKFTSFQRVGRRCYEYMFACVKRNKMDSELLTCLLKFIEYFPDYLSALSRTLLRFFWTTFVQLISPSIYPPKHEK